ncbi:MAG: hypothetical protein DRJ96_00425 [Thermoprotei archaeon]|nr:MAG: hypothetical protein DRJ67_06645 [Thermoprotei archaeon]RLE98652.1 MAG: hypothetical protein DRJ96_00425 [Thermoprotei archaeon]
MAVSVHYVSFHPTLILEGFEEIRLRDPIERVYILYDGKTDKRDRYRAVSRRNALKLSRLLSFFKPIKLPVNPLSYTSAFSRLYAILHYELNYRRTSKVYIDVTDMPPLMAAAAGAVAMMFEGAEIYSVIPDVRGDFIPDPRTPEFDDWIEQKDSAHAQAIAALALPKRRTLVSPLSSERKLRILDTLYSLRGSVRSIKELIINCGEDPERPEVKASYSRLLRELEEEGLVIRIQEGRKRRVLLTEFGKALMRAVKIGEEMARRHETLMPRLRRVRA